MIYLGTSGFADPTWRGAVYPERLPQAQWLIHYEQQLGFNAVELNYTYYAMPEPRTLVGMLKKTSDRFRFAVKAHRSITHDALQGGRITDAPEAFAQFRAGIAPLAQSGRLGCVLAQFPQRFANRPAERDYLERTIDRLADLRLVVEFRHRSWVAPETFALLRQRQVGWCAVDEPALPDLMPWTPEVTAELGYVRFHGRNAEQWHGTSVTERYDYLYSDAELGELADRLRGFPERVALLLVFFNNCHAGAAARNAGRFRELLVEKGLLPAGAIDVPPSLFPNYQAHLL